MIGTALGIAGIAASGIGAYFGFEGAGKQQQAAQQAVAIQQQEMTFEKNLAQSAYQRQQRSIIRGSIIAHANAKSTATNQGAQFSSALPGAYGSIAGATNNNLQTAALGASAVGVKSGFENSMLKANQMAGEGAYESSVGGSLSSLGGALVSNMGNFTKIGTQLGKWYT